MNFKGLIIRGEVNNNVPTLLFLHGSKGLHEKAKNFVLTLSKKSKMNVIAPDDYCWPDSVIQPENTIPTQKSYRSIYEKTLRYRQEKLESTYKYINTLDFTSNKKIFLIGNSAGAVVAARHSGSGFQGVITVGWSYENNYFVNKHETDLTSDIPLCAMIAKNDSIFSKSGIAGKVAIIENKTISGDPLTYLKNREKTKIIYLSDTTHSIYDSQESIIEIINFVKNSN